MFGEFVVDVACCWVVGCCLGIFLLLFGFLVYGVVLWWVVWVLFCWFACVWLSVVCFFCDLSGLAVGLYVSLW